MQNILADKQGVQCYLDKQGGFTDAGPCQDCTEIPGRKDFLRLAPHESERVSMNQIILQHLQVPFF